MKFAPFAAVCILRRCGINISKLNKNQWPNNFILVLNIVRVSKVTSLVGGGYLTIQNSSLDSQTLFTGRPFHPQPEKWGIQDASRAQYIGNEVARDTTGFDWSKIPEGNLTFSV